MIVDLDDYSDAWYEENRAENRREKYKTLYPEGPPRLLFYVETKTSIMFDKLEVETTWNRIQLYFSSKVLGHDMLTALFDIQFFKDGKVYLFKEVEAVIKEEWGYGYDESPEASYYPRVSVMYRSE